MSIKIALAGNPNCGKTTLFNALTGSNQFVGNWPGVTVEKKEGKLKGHDDIIVTDLPGIYSLSPYTLEEVVARDYLIDEKPDVILNIVDGTNLERNLYLTTQLTEIGIPVVIAVNMMDIVRKNGDEINMEKLSKALACEIVEISALKGDGITQAAETAIKAAENEKTIPQHNFSGPVEHAVAHIEEAVLHDMPEERQRWYAIKIFERDERVIKKLKISKEKLDHIEKDISAAERELDDDAESIITNDRYNYITSLTSKYYKRKAEGELTISDKIDRIVTNRILALPIFVAIMFIIYGFVMMPVPMPWGDSLGTVMTNWVNDGLFGEGWYVLGIGQSDYDKAMDEYASGKIWTDKFRSEIDAAVKADTLGAADISNAISSGSFAEFDTAYGTYADSVIQYYEEKKIPYSFNKIYEEATSKDAKELPVRSDYGLWIPGIPSLLEPLFQGVPAWLHGLVFDGIIKGVGSVLGFVPQMFLLFLFLALLESCGYMSRIAFVLDRIFRKFGLSGKSFIPMLVGSGCGVPGIMASRTIESQSDRRMTIITTTFMPCGAKLPVIALFTTVLFGGAWWVAPSAYFLGIASIIISGIMLKKTKPFLGDPAPFVMELPAYHLPTLKNVMRSVWDRGWSFIKKAGTVILLASVIIWLLNSIGWNNYSFGYFSSFDEGGFSILTAIGNTICWIFTPLGFGNPTATIATLMGLLAKEEIVGVFGVVDFEGLTPLAGYSFLAFNLLCAPCFAAIGAIRREMNSPKWTLFAVGYQCAFAYAVSLIIYQIGSVFTNNMNPVGLIFAIITLTFICFMVFRPLKTERKLRT